MWKRIRPLLKELFFGAVIFAFCLYVVTFSIAQSIFLAVAVMYMYSTQRSHRETLMWYARGMELERECDLLLDLQFRVDEILCHPAVDRLFDRLVASGRVNAKDRVAWKESLEKNYRAANKKDDGVERVRFVIRNNVLWKNDIVEGGSAIYHRLFIPYDIKDAEAFWTTVEGLSIRVLVANGILKLQIGSFTKEHSPEVHGRGLQKYRTNETISSFPLMYYSQRLKLPEKFLNVSSYNLDSRYTDSEKHLGYMDDWKTVVKEVGDYNYLCSASDHYWDDDIDRKYFDKVSDTFDRKKKDWLARESFKCPFEDGDGHKSSDWWSIYAFNAYLTVKIVNYAAAEEHNRQFAYPDFWEERP